MGTKHISRLGLSLVLPWLSVAPVEAEQAASPSSYTNGSVFTVTSVFGTGTRRLSLGAPAQNTKSNAPSFDLAVLQFRDDGRLLEARQLKAAEDLIHDARASNRNANGAMVILFIHGWHHGAGWKRTSSTAAGDTDGDSHFHAFRLILESFALREAERYGAGQEAGRRVVGVYVAWNGDPEGSWRAEIPWVTHTTFWDRYGVAERIGAHAEFRDALRKVIVATKESIAESPVESPLVLIGHSMGALMLQSAFATLLEDRNTPLERPRNTPSGPVAIRSGSTPVSFPDLVLSLNSAADSAIAKRIAASFASRSLVKEAAAGAIRYSAPLVVSVTSTGDSDTGSTWPKAKPGRKTDGHDASLFTHDLRLQSGQVTCSPAETLDMGQNWHCLRPPMPLSAASPDFPIDLPVRERNGVGDREVPHARYVIVTRGDNSRAHPMWTFQVPPELIADHNDIFNSRAREFILGLIQISGAVASIAESWERNFEP